MPQDRSLKEHTTVYTRAWGQVAVVALTNQHVCMIQCRLYGLLPSAVWCSAQQTLQLVFLQVLCSDFFFCAGCIACGTAQRSAQQNLQFVFLQVLCSDFFFCAGCIACGTAQRSAQQTLQFIFLQILCSDFFFCAGCIACGTAQRSAQQTSSCRPRDTGLLLWQPRGAGRASFLQ